MIILDYMNNTQLEFWQQCRDWMIAVGALEDDIEYNSLNEFVLALQDGVRLCKLANILETGCIEESTIYFHASDSSVSFYIIVDQNCMET